MGLLQGETCTLERCALGELLPGEVCSWRRHRGYWGRHRWHWEPERAWGQVRMGLPARIYYCGHIEISKQTQRLRISSKHGINSHWSKWVFRQRLLMSYLPKESVLSLYYLIKTRRKGNTSEMYFHSWEIQFARRVVRVGTMMMIVLPGTSWWWWWWLVYLAQVAQRSRADPRPRRRLVAYALNAGRTLYQPPGSNTDFSKTLIENVKSKRIMLECVRRPYVKPNSSALGSNTDFSN